MNCRLKCSCCGSRMFYKIDTFADDRKRERDINGRATCRRGVFNYQYYSTAKTGIKIEIKSTLETYICQNCGHVEFVAQQLVDKIKKDELYFKDKVSILNAELKAACERLDKFRDERYLSFEDFKKIYNKENNSEPVSLWYDYNDRMKGIRTEIEYLTNRIVDIQKEISDYTAYLECVSEIRFK